MSHFGGNITYTDVACAQHRGHDRKIEKSTHCVHHSQVRIFLRNGLSDLNITQIWDTLATCGHVERKNFRDCFSNNPDLLSVTTAFRFISSQQRETIARTIQTKSTAHTTYTMPHEQNSRLRSKHLIGQDIATASHMYVENYFSGEKGETHLRPNSFIQTASREEYGTGSFAQHAIFVNKIVGFNQRQLFWACIETEKTLTILQARALLARILQMWPTRMMTYSYFRHIQSTKILQRIFQRSAFQDMCNDHFTSSGALNRYQAMLLTHLKHSLETCDNARSSHKSVCCRVSFILMLNDDILRGFPFFLDTYRHSPNYRKQNVTWTTKYPHILDLHLEDGYCSKLTLLRGSIFCDTKQTLFQLFVTRTATHAKRAEDDYDYPEDLPQIVLNRLKAASLSVPPNSEASSQPFLKLDFLFLLCRTA